MIWFNTNTTFQAEFTSDDATAAAAFAGEDSFVPVFESVVRIPATEMYTGNYHIVPGTEEQVLETDGLLMVDNVTIAPIPQNYGLITWNGSVLTVS